MLRDNGELIEIPLFILRVILLRLAQLNQMTDGPGDHILVTDQTAFSSFLALQNPGVIPPDRGLFGNADYHREV